MADQELSVSCGSLCHVKCQAGKLRPVDQVVVWINTAMAVATESIQGQKKDPYVNLGIDTGPEEPCRKRHFLKWVRTYPSTQDPLQWLPAPVRGWPQIWIWANLPDFHNLDRMLLRGGSQIFAFFVAAQREPTAHSNSRLCGEVTCSQPHNLYPSPALSDALDKEAPSDSYP